MTDTPPFSHQVAYCTKCRGIGHPSYRPPFAARRQPLCADACPVGEHLHWECGSCGFAWRSLCADAPR